MGDSTTEMQFILSILVLTIMNAVAAEVEDGQETYETYAGQFPFMVALIWQRPKPSYCSGSLITRSSVLTSGTCAVKLSRSLLDRGGKHIAFAVAGAASLDITKDAPVQRMPVWFCEIHPTFKEYKIKHHGPQHEYNVGIAYVKPFKLNTLVKPISVSPYDYDDGVTLISVGFGCTYQPNKPHYKDLCWYKTDVGNKNCWITKKYPKVYCTVMNDTRKYSRFGGGALVDREQNPQLFGLRSTLIGDNQHVYRTVYSKTSVYSEWVNENMWMTRYSVASTLRPIFNQVWIILPYLLVLVSYST